MDVYSYIISLVVSGFGWLDACVWLFGDECLVWVIVLGMLFLVFDFVCLTIVGLVCYPVVLLASIYVCFIGLVWWLSCLGFLLAAFTLGCCECGVGLI